MAIPKQVLSVFFGSTDQDTSNKKVRIGDLVTALNVQQIKGGEFSKRPGTTQVAQSYDGASALAGDSIVSPDGVQVLTRDATTDHVFARSSTNVLNQDQGHADRFVPHVRTRFPALGSGAQQAPMAKQAGKYMVWLVDEGHFKIAELNPSTSAAGGSDTDDAETIVQQTDAISVATISNTGEGAVSSRIKSFAVVDYALFDSDNLWILWVDWSDSIYAWKVPHANLSAGTFSIVYKQAHPSDKRFPVLTSIAMGAVDCGTSDPSFHATLMAIAACGVVYDTTEYYSQPGHGGLAAVNFRNATVSPGTPVASNYAQTMCAHMYLDAATGIAVVGSGSYYLGDWGRMTAAACTIVSVAGGFQRDATKWHYAFIGNFGTEKVSLLLVEVPYNDTSAFVVRHQEQTVPSTAPPAAGLPADYSAAHYSYFGWFYSGQLAAMETAAGVDIAVSVIRYYLSTDNIFRAWNPDYLATQMWRCNVSSGAWALQWTRLGSCVAQGWLRLRDYQATGTYAVTAGKNYLLTIWEDKEALQSCYHVREWDTGDIVAQLAYGEAAHVGHVATRDLQVQGYYTDVQQPMIAGLNQYGGLPLSIVVGLQSQNQNACVDIAVILLQHWDFRSLAKPVWQNPQSVLGFALAPGPIPVIHNGFQRLREAGPLVYPSRPETFLGIPST